MDTTIPATPTMKEACGKPVYEQNGQNSEYQIGYTYQNGLDEKTSVPMPDCSKIMGA